MAVSKRTRFEVLRRDNFTCRYCRSTDGALTVDHVTPVALGGTDDPSNLVTACRDCNAGKSSSAPDAALVADADAHALRWSAAVREAADRLVVEDDARQEYINAFVEVWPSYRRISDSVVHTVGSFYDAGLPVEIMLDCACVAASARGVYDRGAYFAGMCWKRVRALHETAQQILAQQDGEAPS